MNERKYTTECEHGTPLTETCGECVFAEQYQVEPEIGDEIDCDKHGTTTIADEFGFTGYAGGKCYGIELACGCTSLDESNDIAAAY